MVSIGNFEFEAVTINTTALLDLIYNLSQLSTPALIWAFIRGGLWFALFLTIIPIFKAFWLSYRRTKFNDEQDFTILAIDVPVNNEQSPVAVENIFTNFTGIMTTPTFQEKYWNGADLRSLSVEIVSIDGYVQFLVRVNSKFRDIVESAVYAQYPDSQINEIEDYVDKVPNRFPAEGYKMFGMEFKLGKVDALPIRTYRYFEDALAKEFKDPMASLLENMSRLTTGEQLWLQFVIMPVYPNVWEPASQIEADKILGKTKPPKPSLLSKILLAPLNLLVMIADSIGGGEAAGGSGDKSGDDPVMLRLSPGEREKLENIEQKMAKQGFRTNFRMIYVGKKESFNKARGVAAILGSIRQFNTQNLNFIMPRVETVTDIDYFFKKMRISSRQNKLMSDYKDRASNHEDKKKKGFILNTEELATLYHFPLLTVKAPLLKRATGKKSEPPVALAVLAKETEDQAKAEAQGANEGENSDGKLKAGNIASVFTDMPLGPPKE